MSQIDKVLPVQVIIDPSRKGTPMRAVMSPLQPRSLVLLYEDAPPEVHDFKRAELQGDRESGYVLQLSEGTLAVGSKTRKPIVFRDAARSASYRPGFDEVALIFGNDDGVSDDSVCRFNPVTGEQIEPIYFANPTAVAYSPDGSMVAVGGGDGEVTVFLLTQTHDVEEIRSVRVPGGIRALVFEELLSQVYVATENNALISFSYNNEEDEPVRRTLQLVGGRHINNMCLNTLAYSQNCNLVGAAGVGNEVWVSNPLKASGRYITLRETTRIWTVQFDHESDTLAIFGDFGVELVEFSMDAEFQAAFSQRTIRFSPRFQMVGCHHYGHFLFIASILPED